MDLVIEILLEIYSELMFLVIPEKNASKNHILLVKIAAVTMFLVLVALFVWGLVLLVDKNNCWGAVPIAVAVLVSLVQIIAGIVLYKKHH